MGAFIDALPISDLDKGKLKQLGTETPFGLLSLIRAAPVAFDSLMGHSAQLIKRQLESMVSVSEREYSEEIPDFSLGAQIERLPSPPSRSRQIQLRDQLFEEWQGLQRDPATRDSDRSKELKAKLDALLSSE